ncbi:MAG: ROK family protein [Gammaproteobacteria bacterium]|nr:ROK family protein [Gammaproteobacteria bacterium]
MTELKLGIDLGGTKIASIVLDGSGQVIREQRVRTPSDDYQAILAQIKTLSRQAEADVDQVMPVGIATPGALSPESGLLRNSNTLCLNGKNLQQDLEQVVDRPVRLANDANCFALSEAMDGSAATYNMVFGVIIGTGTGAGLVFKKQLITGPHAIAGEWGHNPLPWLQSFDKVRQCYCGQSGCIETFLSGPGMAANCAALTSLKMDSHALIQCSRAGDQQCQQQMMHYYDQMARALAHVINILDPDVIVLGGGMSNIEELYTEVPARWQSYVFSDYVTTPLLKPRYGDASGVRGAAWLWDE